MYSLLRVSGLYGVTVPIPLSPMLYSPCIAHKGVQGESRCSCAARRAHFRSQILDIGSEICYRRSRFAVG